MRITFERVVPLSVAILSLSAGAVFGYLSVPHDLQLKSVHIGRLSDFPDLARVPQQDVYAMRIGFTSSADIRGMSAAESASDGTDISAVPCDCNWVERRKHGDTCDINLGPFPYDRFGEIQHHYNVLPEHSSRSKADENVIEYHFYVPIRQWGASERPYNLAAKPMNLCVRLDRFGYFRPTWFSNLMVVPKEAIAAAVAQRHIQ